MCHKARPSRPVGGEQLEWKIITGLCLPPLCGQRAGGRALRGGGHGWAVLEETVSARGCSPLLPQLAVTPGVQEGLGASLLSQRELSGVLSGEGPCLLLARS